MAAQTTAGHTPRTYGNWVRPASPGLLGLGSLGTAILLGGLVASVITVMVLGVLAGVGMFAVVGLLVLTVKTKDRHGKNVMNRGFARAGFWRARQQRATIYRSGPLGQGWGTAQLPGLAAQTKLLEAETVSGQRFALVHTPSTKHYTIVFGAEPDGSGLVDEEQIDQWVSGWSHWLTDLGDEPGLDAASVTVETAPDTGVRLNQEVEANIDQSAPAFAQSVLREAVQRYPEGSAVTTVMVALTFNANTRVGGKRRSHEEIARDLATRIPHLANGLVSSGAGAARPMTAQELCEVIRTAYNPGVALTLHEAYAAGHEPELTWPEVGPVAAQSDWDSYRHDDATSVTWSMTEAPRGLVQANILARLLAPHRDVARKRVTLLYRPIDAARAAAMVESDLRTAEFLSSTSDKPTARSVMVRRAAEATAREEAAGAGLVNFGLLVTATVAKRDGLPDAIAAVDNLGATARLRLRPVYGSQDSAFAAALPLGLVLRRHLKVPADISGRL
ncbi:SCO6880 family protein [Luteipulveratus flavus]|uniref:Integral membrane protein n=1 Tax=Luteipulveratus flavus TaxID=3031728 RepID=A0ABT6C3R5_9MICO|nr:SCO6880 family protein [Luteipulveratus sp. YIM 133296]MDF8263512.1 hypothetical protein [Luteipulveratus sp. YIM 133296]